MTQPSPATIAAINANPTLYKGTSYAQYITPQNLTSTGNAPSTGTYSSVQPQEKVITSQPTQASQPTQVIQAPQKSPQQFSQFTREQQQPLQPTPYKQGVPSYPQPKQNILNPVIESGEQFVSYLRQPFTPQREVTIESRQIAGQPMGVTEQRQVSSTRASDQFGVVEGLGNFVAGYPAMAVGTLKNVRDISEGTATFEVKTIQTPVGTRDVVTFVPSEKEQKNIKLQEAEGQRMISEEPLAALGSLATSVAISAGVGYGISKAGQATQGYLNKQVAPSMTRMEGSAKNYRIISETDLKGKTLYEGSIASPATRLTEFTTQHKTLGTAIGKTTGVASEQQVVPFRITVPKSLTIPKGEGASSIGLMKSEVFPRSIEQGIYTIDVKKTPTGYVYSETDIAGKRTTGAVNVIIEKQASKITPKATYQTSDTTAANVKLPDMLIMERTKAMTVIRQPKEIYTPTKTDIDVMKQYDIDAFTASMKAQQDKLYGVGTPSVPVQGVASPQILKPLETKVITTPAVENILAVKLSSQVALNEATRLAGTYGITSPPESIATQLYYGSTAIGVEAITAPTQSGFPNTNQFGSLDQSTRSGYDIVQQQGKGIFVTKEPLDQILINTPKTTPSDIQDTGAGQVQLQTPIQITEPVTKQITQQVTTQNYQSITPRVPAQTFKPFTPVIIPFPTNKPLFKQKKRAPFIMQPLSFPTARRQSGMNYIPDVISSGISKYNIGKATAPKITKDIARYSYAGVPTKEARSIFMTPIRIPKMKIRK